MPTSVAQFSASRELTVVRRPLRCESTATVLRQGPAGECGGAPGWPLFLCPGYSEGRTASSPTDRRRPAGKTRR